MSKVGRAVLLGAGLLFPLLLGFVLWMNRGVTWAFWSLVLSFAIVCASLHRMLNAERALDAVVVVHRAWNVRVFWITMLLAIIAVSVFVKIARV